MIWWCRCSSQGWRRIGIAGAGAAHVGSGPILIAIKTYLHFITFIDGTCCWNPSSCKTSPRLSCIINTMTADGWPGAVNLGCSTGRRCHCARMAYVRNNEQIRSNRSPIWFGGTSSALLFRMCCVSVAYQWRMGDAHAAHMAHKGPCPRADPGFEVRGGANGLRLSWYINFNIYYILQIRLVITYCTY